MRELEVNIEYAKRWRATKIQDTRTNATGLVIDAVNTEAGVRLRVIFPDSKEPRLVSLSKEADLECLVPGFGRARYRVREEA
jgi:hypothetical protein